MTNYKHIKNVALLSLGLMLSGCLNKKNQNDSQKVIHPMTYYKEKFRPQFHFSPEEKWMNDPNGLVYHKGIYHLFYQYYPEDIVWGPMHWGHAVSKDLISWEHEPIALFPDEHGYIFSGSAVVDKENTSGFSTKENPPLIAIFTYHLIEGEKAGRDDFQTQGIAYSLDNGDSWTKYIGNPVIGNSGIKDFRDPKVFWHDETSRWIMALVAGDHVKFYSSPDLKNWTYLSDFGKDKGAHGGVWECPDLFKLKVEGTDEEKWVLLISINPGAPNGGSGTQYFIGDFDGKAFTVEHSDEKWIDYGADNYAGVTFNNTPNNERIFIGWMSNWNYAQNTPTSTWRGAMTLPRELSLNKRNNGYYLKNYPIESFDESLKQTYREKELFIGSGNSIIDQPSFNSSEIKFDMNLTNNLSLTLKSSNDEQLKFIVDQNSSQILLDRTKSGKIDFEERFADKVHVQNFNRLDKNVEVRLIIDKSSIEIFIDKGRYVFTEQIFPVKDYNKLEINSKEVMSIKDLKISKVKSIWNEK